MHKFNIHICMLFAIVTTSFANNDNINNVETIHQNNTVVSDFDYYFSEANRQKQLGNIPESIDLFIKSYDINPNSAAVSFELGLLFLQQNAYDMGLGYLQNAVKLDASNVQYLQKLADLYYETDRWNDVIPLLHTIQKLSPQNEQVLLQLAMNYANIKQHKTSLNYYHQYGKKVGKVSRNVMFGTANQYIALNQHKKAYRYLNQQIKISPEYAMFVNIYKGQREVERKNYSAAKRYIKKADSMNPESGHVCYAWVYYYMSTNQVQLAEDYAAKVFLSNDFDIDQKIEAYEVFKNYYNNKPNRIQRLEQIIQNFTITHSDVFVPYVLHAELLIEANKHAEAASPLYTAVLLEPSCAECWIELVKILVDLEDETRLLVVAKQAVEALPQHPILQFYAGMALLINENKEQAYPHFVKTLEYAANQEVHTSIKVYCLAMMIDYHLSKNDYTKVLSLCDEALTLEPENILLLNNCSYTMALLNVRLEEAEKMSYKTLLAEPQNSYYLDTFAYISFRLKRYELALYFIEKALEYDDREKKTHIIYERYGDILYFLNQKDKAIEKWTIALDNFSDDASEEERVTLERKINETRYVE